MHKKTFNLLILFLSILFIVSSCKKSSSPTANGNSPHALSDVFYIRALIDTTWIYQSNNHGDECQTAGSVCSAFLLFTQNSNYAALKFELIDSAHASPQDSIILSWKGKTFVTASDTAASHAYLFRFEYPDTSGREMSTDYVINNTGARLTIDSIVYDGVSQQGYVDTTGTPAKSYRIKGSISCQIAHLGDSAKYYHKVMQGVYSINIIEAK